MPGVRIFLVALRSGAVCLATVLLGACADNRRDAVREHVEATVPGNTRLVELDEAYRFEQVGGRSRTQVLVKYETVLPTVREVDAMTLPEGSALRRRVAEVRGWALATVPEDDPARSAILDAAGEALRGFKVKRVLTPAATQIAAVVTLELEVEGTGWRVADAENTAYLSGEPDRQPDLPYENSPEMHARFSELSLLAEEMERMRERFLAQREKTARETRAAITRALVTGSTFDGSAVGPGGSRIPVRLVVSRGLDLGETVVGALATGTEPQRSAQFTGHLLQRGNGEFYLEVVRSRVLSGEGEFPNERGSRPRLRLFLANGGLKGAVEDSASGAYQLTLAEGDKVDVLPEVDPVAESGYLQ